MGGRAALHTPHLSAGRDGDWRSAQLGQMAGTLRIAERNGGPFSNQVHSPSHSSIVGSSSAPVCPPRWLPASISSSDSHDSHLKRRIRLRFVLGEQSAVPMGLRAGLACGEFTFLSRLGTTGRAADSEFLFCHCGHHSIHCRR